MAFSGHMSSTPDEMTPYAYICLYLSEDCRTYDSVSASLGSAPDDPRTPEYGDDDDGSINPVGRRASLQPSVRLRTSWNATRGSPYLLCIQTPDLVTFERLLVLICRLLAA